MNKSAFIFIAFSTFAQTTIKHIKAATPADINKLRDHHAKERGFRPSIADKAIKLQPGAHPLYRSEHADGYYYEGVVVAETEAAAREVFAKHFDLYA